MARRRFFVDQVRKGEAEITGDEAHHLTRVLRVEAGQKFEISDGARVWLASVEEARKAVVRFAVLEELPAGPELPPVTLYLALIKFDRFEWAVEKATELGVARIVPVQAERSDYGLFQGSQKRGERWRRIAHEAGEQSRRLRPPEVAEAVKFADAVKSAAAHRIWLDEQPGAKPLAAAFSFAPGDTVSHDTDSGDTLPGDTLPNDSCSLLIGPEGGWADSERHALAAAGWTGASLGPMVLRAETAVCAALAVVSQMWMAAHAE